jgi:O-antigen ligase/polysaccharide polymerase Wzy-like membrane protein
MKSEKKTSGIEFYALAFGLFLGLCIWKFGNPVILDSKITQPNSASEFWNYAWPTHWANWILLPIAIVGAILAMAKKSRWPRTKWLWLLPLLWFGWQLFSATQTVDADLTSTTLWQFFGCAACYFLGTFLFGGKRALNFLLVGILAAFTFCLVRAIDQRIFEFPQSRQILLEDERASWTNVPPEMFLQMKQDGVVITTNGVDLANPAILAKFAKGRVNGTLVYPNALAGIILLLFPVSLMLALNSTKSLKSPIRCAAIALTLFLGVAGFFWTGSKLAWLIAIAVICVCLFRLNWSARLKFIALGLIIFVGLGIFAVRFQNYFAAGATSVGARFDYWRAAVQTTCANPIVGSGPGTFQRPYAKIKSPDAEMARLAHNDYLEQFSDSGIPGGIFYASWIFLSLATIARRAWKSGNQTAFAIFAGMLGWFVQGIGEFSLYVPALAWTAFTLLGCSLALTANQFDKKLPDV